MVPYYYEDEYSTASAGTRGMRVHAVRVKAPPHLDTRQPPCYAS
jgi:hypothetical protein